ncbi:MAG: rhamnogalacturonan endolyase family protein [Actinomycetota bacterium]
MTAMRRGAWKPGRESWFLASLLLLLVLIISMAIYLIRVNEVERRAQTGGRVGNRDTRQMNPDLPPPRAVKVTVDKGATVSWEGQEDARIIGYNVYRYRGREDDTGEKINAAIVSDTVYHDDEGTMFNSYAVAPVDDYGREGKRSEQVAAVVEPKSISGLVPTSEPVVIENVTFREQTPTPELPTRLVDCTGEGMGYFGTWYLERYAEVTGGTLMVTPYQGNHFSYTFAGDGVAVISTRHWNYGIMEVYLDGELRAVVDLFAPETRVRQRVFEASGLGPGAHTIKMVCTGRRNPSANFTFINLEALEILPSP